MSRERFTGATREDLIEMITVLAEENEGLHARVRDLERLVRSKGKPPSSTPSSQKPPWEKPKPKGEKGKKPGRKPGHPGTTRKRPENPDKTIEHSECNCPDCGSQLHDIEERRQVVEEIVPARVEIHEHVWLRGHCPHCKKSRDLRPADVRPGAYLGTRTVLWAAWMRVHLNMPFGKVSELLEKLCGLRVSRGGLSQALKSVARQFGVEVKEIEAALRGAGRVFADETGMRVSGENNWLWFFGNDRHARIRIEKTRSGKVVTDVLGEVFEGLLHCDFYAAYNAIDSAKQRCLSHLAGAISDLLKGRGRGRPPPFLKSTLQWLRDALDLEKRWCDGLTLSTCIEYRRRLERRLDGLIAMNTSDPDALRLQKRLRKHRDELLEFLYWGGGEGTNNRAERGIRPAVMLRKVSGGHRSWPGAEALASVMTVLHTCGLQGRDFIDTGLEIIGRQMRGEPSSVLA